MSLGGTGLRDWKIQRMSALYLGFYVIGLSLFCLYHSPLEFNVWHHLFTLGWFKILTLLAVILMGVHAWIGIWIVLTDYVKKLSFNYGLQMISLLSLLGFIVWGTKIIWSVP